MTQLFKHPPEPYNIMLGVSWYPVRKLKVSVYISSSSGYVSVSSSVRIFQLPLILLTPLSPRSYGPHCDQQCVNTAVLSVPDVNEHTIVCH